MYEADLDTRKWLNVKEGSHTYLREGKEIGIYEYNVDTIKERTLTVNCDGELKDLKEGQDYTAEVLEQEGKWKKKDGKTAVFAAAIILYGIFLGMPVWGQSRLQRGIAREVLRFHVLADSDSTEDRVLKMQVKDVLVEKLNGLLQGL